MSERGGTTLRVLVVLAIMIVGLALYVIDLPHLASDDMAPSLRLGDQLLACRLCGAPKRGDLVNFAIPDAPGQMAVRRVVAGPGDRVEVHKGEVLVNGKPLEHTKPSEVTLTLAGGALEPGPHLYRIAYEQVGTHRYAILSDFNATSTSDRPPETLRDEYFVLADRRTFIRDSRDYGPVARGLVRSVVWRVLSVANGETERQTRVP
jgi:signal peptidase I